MNVTTSIRIAALVAGISLLGAAGSASAFGPTSPTPVGSVDFPYEDFYAVPQLGTEAVVGTACGGNGSIGDTIPDGIWRGYVTSFDGPTVYESTSLQFNLICVYVGAEGDRLRSEWQTTHPGEQQYGFPDGFMVDNNPRTRTVPLSIDFVMAGAVVTTLNQCAVPAVPAFVGDRPQDMYLTTDSWLVIQGGQAVTVVTSCAAGGGEVIQGCFSGGYVEGFASTGDRPRCD
jgi:hypothetical protein